MIISSETHKSKQIDSLHCAFKKLLTGTGWPPSISIEVSLNISS